MTHSVSLEQMEGRWLAFVDDLPGCFAGEDTQQDALAVLPAAVSAYGRWRRLHGDGGFSLDPAPSFAVAEMIREWPDPAHPDYMVNAFLAADAPPLTSADVTQLLALAQWAYADLLTAGNVPDIALRQPVEADWSIERILTHCSHAAWWYLTRLGCAPPAATEPPLWNERLAAAHHQFLVILPSLVGVARIELRDCELWSPRKLVRRSIWHLRDHTQHIGKFRARLSV